MRSRLLHGSHSPVSRIVSCAASSMMAGCIWRGTHEVPGSTAVVLVPHHDSYHHHHHHHHHVDTCTRATDAPSAVPPWRRFGECVQRRRGGPSGRRIERIQSGPWTVIVGPRRGARGVPVLPPRNSALRRSVDHQHHQHLDSIQ